MQDIRKIRELRDKYKEAAKDKNISIDIDKLLELDKQKNKLLNEIEELRAERNKNAQEIKRLGGKPPVELIEAGKKIKEQIQKQEEKYKKIEQEFRELMLWVPNIAKEDTPIGKDDSENIVIRYWSPDDKNGEPKKFDFEIKDHIELAKINDLIDFERGVKVSGFRGYFLKNEAVLMHMGLMQYGIKKMIEKGFILLYPPSLVKEWTLYGSGHFPFGLGDAYEIGNRNETETGALEEEKTYLSATAEIGIGGYHAGEVLDEENLPLKYVGFNPCYRREIGSYGRDTRGIYRIHEFLKIEQFIICQDDYNISDKLHEELVSISEEFLQDLKLPYRIIRQCTGDMGAGKYKMYDIETWMPGRIGYKGGKGAYGETHSASNLGDWQARRLNIQYKDKNGNKHFVHTLNNTMVASPRILIAIFENYQNKDRSITVPEVLRNFVGKEIIKRK